MAVPRDSKLSQSELEVIKDSTFDSSRDNSAEIDEDIEINRTWKRSYLKVQRKLFDLDRVYKTFVNKINHGYLSLYLLLQISLSAVHLSIVIYYNRDDVLMVIPDVILLLLLCIFSLLGLFINEKYNEYNSTCSVAISMITLFMLIAFDLSLPIYHLLQNNTPTLRPAYGTLTIIACYVFFPINNTLIAFTFGALTTVCNLLIIGTVTYKDSSNIVEQLISDGIYFACINATGLYFRYINEIIKGRTFIDRYYGVLRQRQLENLKRKEDAMLSRLIPTKHMVTKVKEAINTAYAVYERNEESDKKFTIDELASDHQESFFEEHSNVSILYADIVNFTMMSSKLDVVSLIKLLTYFFGQFDQAAEACKVFRIKFLGDCYYGVSGLPPLRSKTHADNCVQLGVKMINIIHAIREQRNLSIDLRIGIHSGKLCGGIIGLTKWQYDIWSKDVILANLIESSGEAGKIHISQQTKDLLTKDYNCELRPNELNFPDLNIYGIKSYLITPQMTTGIRISTIKYVRPADRRSSARRTTNEDTNVKSRFEEDVTACNLLMDKAIKAMALSKFAQWLKPSSINPLLLTFHSIKDEIKFIQLPDPLFKYYILHGIFVLVCLIFLQYDDWVFLKNWEWTVWLPYLTLTVYVFVLFPITWAAYLWRKLRLRNPKGHNEERENYYATVCDKLSDFITNCVSVRVIIYLVACCLLALCTLSDIVSCKDFHLYNYETRVEFVSTRLVHQSCPTTWNVTESFAMVLIMNFVFFKINIWLKFIFSCIVTALYSYYIISAKIFKIENATWNINVPTEVSHVTAIAFLGFTLHLIDRQTEYLNKLGCMWHNKLKSEQVKILAKRSTNNYLLTNILPLHIADLFHNYEREFDHLYHEEFRQVAVLFATIKYDNPNVVLYDENSLKIVHKIVSEFDTLLKRRYGSNIEKIKLAGWSYMAACGVVPGNNVHLAQRRSSVKHPLVFMTQFALDMLETIEQINKKLNTRFKLRIGMSHGKISAGVVGAKQPFYDIWGDPVNMASRMDSTGVPGRIQVLKESSVVLTANDIKTEPRGIVYVKGKGEVETFFVVSEQQASASMNGNAGENESQHKL